MLPLVRKMSLTKRRFIKLPVDSHVRLAKEVDLPILRRSYSYSDGIDERTGQFDAGLIFIAYQKDPDRFVKIQTNLGAVDKMNEYITHIGSGLFACFAGVEKGGYLGQALLNKLLVLLGFLALFLTYPVAAESYSDLYIKITDATTAVQNKDQAKAKELVGEIKTDFETKENHDSKAGKKVSKALDIKGDVTEEDLTSISSALLKFEKEQNPVDLDAEKEKLETRLNPYFKNLQDAITAKDLAATRKTYGELNNAWTRNEAVVRDHSTAYYGKIETAISLLRSSIETEPTDFTSIQSSYDDLKGGIDDFIKGVPLDSTSSSLTLKDGIKLLEKALGQFQSGDEKTAAATMKKFITIWPTIEGDVSTTNPSLYTRVESETPVIMVKGKEKAYQDKLQALITDLSAIDTSASYNAFDAMLILLREGVEALLIVMALVTTLKAAKMRKGLKWVYGGAIAGVLASALIAVILQVVFPAVTSGANREIIEGGVGIFAVAMMILIGIWLHSKSSVKQWNDFMDRQMKTV